MKGLGSSIGEPRLHRSLVRSHRYRRAQVTGACHRGTATLRDAEDEVVVQIQRAASRSSGDPPLKNSPPDEGCNVELTRIIDPYEKEWWTLGRSLQSYLA